MDFRKFIIYAVFNITRVYATETNTVCSNIQDPEAIIRRFADEFFDLAEQNSKKFHNAVIYNAMNLDGSKKGNYSDDINKYKEIYEELIRELFACSKSNSSTYSDWAKDPIKLHAKSVVEVLTEVLKDHCIKNDTDYENIKPAFKILVDQLEDKLTLEDNGERVILPKVNIENSIELINKEFETVKFTPCKESKPAEGINAVKYNYTSEGSVPENVTGQAYAIESTQGLGLHNNNSILNGPGSLQLGAHSNTTDTSTTTWFAGSSTLAAIIAGAGLIGFIIVCCIVGFVFYSRYKKKRSPPDVIYEEIPWKR